MHDLNSDLCNRWDIVNLVSPLIPRRCIITRCKEKEKGNKLLFPLTIFKNFPFVHLQIRGQNHPKHLAKRRERRLPL